MPDDDVAPELSTVDQALMGALLITLATQNDVQQLLEPSVRNTDCKLALKNLLNCLPVERSSHLSKDACRTL